MRMAMPAPAEYRWCGATDVGRSRTRNEDAVLPTGPGAGPSGIVAVADGLGGHPGGDIASACVIDAIASAPPDSDGPSLVAAAHDSLLAHIVESLDSNRELIAMATTLTLAILGSEGVVEVAHVGDSRAYVFDGTSLSQVTEDHTRGMDRVVAGEMTLAEAQASPAWHVLSNWLGFESYRVATHRVPVRPGYRLLLCTDGLTNMLADDEIAALLTGDPESAAAALIDAANAAGGADNISVVVVEVLDEEHNGDRSTWVRSWGRSPGRRSPCPAVSTQVTPDTSGYVPAKSSIQ